MPCPVAAPYRSRMASFFQGSVTEAVADSRAGFKPLLVLLTGV